MRYHVVWCKVVWCYVLRKGLWNVKDVVGVRAMCVELEKHRMWEIFKYKGRV